MPDRRAPLTRDELEEALDELLRDLGLPADSYGRPDATALREMVAWWPTYRRDRRESEELLECLRRWRGRMAAMTMTALGLAASGAWAAAVQVWPLARPYLTELLKLGAD